MNPQLPPASSPSLADAVERIAASVVGVGTQRRGHGAGVLWKPGVVVTSASVLGRHSRLQVTLADGRGVAAEVRGVDPGTDLAVLIVDAQDMPVAERPSDAAPRVGDFVFAVGRDPSGAVHASFGHVGAAGPAWRTWRGGAVERWIRLDGGLWPGLQGSPVAEAGGRVIGIASAALSRHHGVVLPVATVDRVSAALLEHGRVSRGVLGVAVQTVALAEPVRQALGIDARTGLLVHGLADDGPASRAGVMVGDIIVAAGGRPVGTVDALRDRLAAEPVGALLRLRLSRGGQPIEVDAGLAERPPRHCE